MKDKILAEVRKHWIPNFGLLRQKESLDVLPELLNELLEIEKEKFKKLINKDNESLTFDDFIEPSDLDYLWRLLNVPPKISGFILFIFFIIIVL